MSFRLVQKSVTLNDFERVMAVTLRYFTEFRKHTFQHITAASSCGGIFAGVYCVFYHVYDVVVKKVHVRYTSPDEFLVFCIIIGTGSVHLMLVSFLCSSPW